MFRRILFPLAIICLTAGIATADPLAVRGPAVIHGGPGTTAKAEVDTVNLMSSHNDPTNGAGEPAYYGDFEDFITNPSWNDWTSVDLTQTVGESYWHVSEYRHLNGTWSAWCGDIDIPSCSPADTVGGYGRHWYEILEWRATVPLVEQPCTVTLDAYLNLDTMPGYDYGILRVLTDAGPVELWSDAGLMSGYHLQESFFYDSWTYAGDGEDEIVVQFLVTSDGGWDNEDCLWIGAGAMQVDDITVTLSQGGVSTFDDFEDGTLGNWQALDSPGAGDYAKIWSYLEEMDPCRSNYTPQVAFIDDGFEPGTTGTMCIDWCYGPGGYIVNNTGGVLSYRQENLHNAIVSPVMAWPAADHDGALLEFGVYHQVGLASDEPRIYYTWEVRSADTDGSGGQGTQTLADQPWVNRGALLFGYGNYERVSADISDLLVPGRDEVQVRLAVVQQLVEYGLLNGNPTPYLDNVAVKAYEKSGPALSALSAHLANDGFPQGGTLDAVDPGAASVRFDMARNIAGNEDPLGPFINDPGDSIVVRVAPLGAGAVISPAPRLEYRLERRLDWDGMRTAGLPDAGYVAGTEVLDPVSGLPTGEWAFDLPDTGFFLPGDVLHYLVVATETGPGGTTQMFLPADTTGFHDFSHNLAYDIDFTVRALPGVTDPFDKTVITSGGPALFWFDAEDKAGLETWINELDVIADDPYFSTFAYDLFVTRDPASGLGNGLGGRTTAVQLANYGTLLYSSGEESMRTLGDGAPWRDVSDDMGLIWDWLQGPDRQHLFMTGDNLVSDLYRSGGGIQFAQDVLGVDLVDPHLRPLIDNQVTPRVVPIGGTGLFLETPSWIAYGGCLRINHFDAVQARTGYLPAAEFTDPAGQPGVYPYAAAVTSDSADDHVISVPYDLMFVYTDPSAPPMIHSARQALLSDVLHAFMYMWGPIGDVPGTRAKLAADIHPNPFNPRVTIDYTVPAPGRLSVKIYDVRGRLVRTVMDEKVQTAGKAVWDGRDDRGGEAASGVYFYEVRLGQDVEIGKMALVR